MHYWEDLQSKLTPMVSYSRRDVCLQMIVYFTRLKIISTDRIIEVRGFRCHGNIRTMRNVGRNGCTRCMGGFVHLLYSVFQSSDNTTCFATVNRPNSCGSG